LCKYKAFQKPYILNIGTIPFFLKKERAIPIVLTVLSTEEFPSVRAKLNKYLTLSLKINLMQ
jgi:hypothetical protein